MSFQMTSPSQVEARPSAAAAAGLLSQAFLWMFAGLLLTAGVTFVVEGNASVKSAIGDAWIFVVLGQLALAWAIGLGIRRMNATLALGLFFVYAASLGFTIGVIVAFYEAPSVFTAFLSASAMFGGAGIYGVVTKRSLAGMGGLLSMALIGLIVAILLNLFFANDTLSLIISLIGVVLFTALTAYDTQRIASGAFVAYTGSVEKAAVLGALHLYLDFVNLFLFLLRLLGNRR